VAEEKICPKCQAPLPTDAPAGICPKCLMEKAFVSTVGYEGPRARLPEPGETFGPYEIGQQLGSGGMGAVYAAKNVNSGRRVALKVLNHRLDSTEHRQRFLREGRLAAAVNHPHSVYIFGTEEIDGSPVIAMELADGGTLQDRVRREGPLPVGVAVDVVLQIIDGLEAAESAGVLHRDVKPSNCFLDADGAVKIGDFGLSISTASRNETNLTHSGVFLGTPAFSSPEQLRGDELDLRSDIYSLGVTMFYLLTGRTPFEAKQMVQLLATVLERPAPSPAEFRKEIPAGLGKVVQRCLEKQPARRYASYDELRTALLPYASAAPTPATLGLRLVAHIIDSLIIAAIAAIIPLTWARDAATWHFHFQAILAAEPFTDSRLMALGVLGVLLMLAYFTLCEGLTGTTGGKSICRLRVIRGNRERPGLYRSALRASIFLSAFLLPWWLGFAVDAAAGTHSYVAAEPWMFASSIAATILLFTTARRRNGFAGIHELASGTRVVGLTLHQPRPTVDRTDDPLPEADSEEMFGPYHVLGPLATAPAESFVLGYDRRLLRKVWIRKCAGDAAPVPPDVRELTRSGRLRWLDGQRSAAGGWDAYEAPSGKPLLQLVTKPQPWNSVRFWLCDLAEELSASREDGSTPAVLELDRVWITAEGRAKLLDFRSPQLDAKSQETASSGSFDRTASDAAIFLKRVAIAALEDRIVSAKEAQSRDLEVPIPLSARERINPLGQSAEPSIDVAELKRLTEQSASVSPAKRIAVLAACFIVPLALAALVTTFYWVEARVFRERPELGKLVGYLELYHSLDEQDTRRTAVEILVADRYREIVEDSNFWSKPSVEQFLKHVGGRELVERMVQSHPNSTDEQVSDAFEKLVTPYYGIDFATAEFYSVSLPIVFLALCAVFVVSFAMIPSYLTVMLMGNSLLLSWLEIAIVTKTGEPASRLRVLLRNTVFWSLTFIALSVFTYAATIGRPTFAMTLLIFMIAGTLAAQRGLHDRLSGTWLVPR